VELAESLRAGGYRLTPQRQLVLDAVSQLGHATPDEVHAWVQERSSAVNLSTVYRTLELLEKLGLVTHTHLSHGAPTYHPAGSHTHAHLACHDCGAVTELQAHELDDIVDRVRQRTGFAVDVGHLTLFGRCSDCRSTDQ
jgi:Fur family ferric uptake transcriptional regulator